MKILAFADLHGSKTALTKLQQNAKKHKPDIMLCAGDFTIFERDMRKILTQISKLGQVYLVHGNHENPATVKTECTKFRTIQYAHKRIIKIGKYTLIGYGGGGFSIRDRGFERFIEHNSPKLRNKNLILLTHGPPYNTKLDYLNYFKEHVGCESYTKFIKKYKPILAVSGHLHESFGKEDRIGKTKAINPGPNGKIIQIP